MELRKGYKQTEVGIIPEDWNVKCISEIVEVDPENLVSNTNPEYVFQYISLEDVDNGILRSNTELKFKNAPSRARRKIKKGDILVSTVRPNLKSHLLIKEDLKNWVCSTGFSVLRGKENTNSEFLFNHFFSSIINRQIENLITGSNYPAINSKEVKQLLLPVPPNIKEQSAIAAALSDMDALISSLEKLIEKKRMIKQGIMQKLLTPKKGWEVKPFKDYCWFQEGPGLRNWQFTNSGVKVINVTNLENGVLNLERTDRYISLEEFNRMYKHFEIDESDIVVASSGNSYGKVSVVRKQDLPLLMNTSVIRFKPMKDLNYYYLLIFLKSNKFKNQIDLLITGGAQPNFGPVHLNKITIDLPSTIEEQNEISSILMDMENELNKLEEQLGKYRKLKFGIMQNLLTGKIRLV